MPHLSLQYTANLAGYDADAALARINQALALSGHFDELAIKSRACALEHYRVGTAERGRAFVHARLKILPGRSEAVRGALSGIVLAALRDSLPPHYPSVQLCVEVDELYAPAYAKTVLDANLP
ncbi:5-carboxymethyl-2-hydroxymuconate Delta-isomerase [Lysobacter sp. CCNWLW3]|uniref:5-carboxymethyl-2-hydroxymuconate Delta-isomerase n=1 Tax=unclassified Lysobacter TaxID=2635362 RepID=UPI002FD16A4D